jgi:hypothetical protein
MTQASRATMALALLWTVGTASPAVGRVGDEGRSEPLFGFIRFPRAPT